MNPELDRWLKASLAKHFRTLCTVNSIDFMTERQIRDTGSLNEWVELRVIGPEYKRLGNNDYVICIEVDLLVTVTPSKDDILRIDSITGLLSVNCDNIEITDGTNHLFCLMLDSDTDKNVRVISYGQQYGIKQRRASVLAIYEIETTLV